MKIALAQIQPIKGNIEKNIYLHTTFINQAISKNADAIFFPELSLTSYEPALANELKLEPNDKRLLEFQKLSDSGNITIGIGAPINVQEGIQIAMLIFKPNQPIQKYAKQILHEDELPYFCKGDKQVILENKAVKIAPAICYESLQAEHLKGAIGKEANLYLASVAKSQPGIDKATRYFPEAAKKHSIPILMVNSIGYCDNFQSAGQSAIWNSKGVLLEQLPKETEGMLIYNFSSLQMLPF